MVRGGRAAAAARIVSSQHARPPPRSLAQCHQPLRGVMTTTGGRSAVVPRTVAVTLPAVVGRSDDVGDDRHALASTDETVQPIRLGRRHLHHRHAERLREPTGVHRREPGLRAARDPDDRAMTAAAAQGIERSPFARDRRAVEIDERNLRARIRGTQTPAHAFRPRESAVEQRQPFDRPSPAADRARPYIDPRQVEPFQRRHRAGRARLLHAATRPTRRRRRCPCDGFPERRSPG